ncbi:uncharacterized protein LOC116349360 isoform X2 [Contarinia nasturtii]|uniref:uncharacterized protein LOC116349360 isoform X2 n=1 Tax=Contarinia nasturtii TaxID=265458 RepID=UPI0012D3D369|nr:uncharacterized protein LOC116349360 isoform X2 [Contarinia nasturtii]
MYQTIFPYSFFLVFVALAITSQQFVSAAPVSSAYFSDGTVLTGPINMSGYGKSNVENNIDVRVGVTGSFDFSTNVTWIFNGICDTFSRYIGWGWMEFLKVN